MSLADAIYIATRLAKMEPIPQPLPSNARNIVISQLNTAGNDVEIPRITKEESNGGTEGDIGGMEDMAETDEVDSEVELTSILPLPPLLLEIRKTVPCSRTCGRVFESYHSAQCHVHQCKQKPKGTAMCPCKQITSCGDKLYTPNLRSYHWSKHYFGLRSPFRVSKCVWKTLAGSGSPCRSREETPGDPPTPRIAKACFEFRLTVEPHSSSLSPVPLMANLKPSFTNETQR